MQRDSTATVAREGAPSLSQWAELIRDIDRHIAACPACDRLLGSGFAGCERLQALEGR